MYVCQDEISQKQRDFDENHNTFQGISMESVNWKMVWHCRPRGEYYEN